LQLLVDSGRGDSAVLAKPTEPTPTKASPRLRDLPFAGDLRHEKVSFTRMGVKFTFYEFQPK
jgi:hypothetical protein